MLGPSRFIMTCINSVDVNMCNVRLVNLLVVLQLFYLFVHKMVVPK